MGRLYVGDFHESLGGAELPAAREYELQGVDKGRVGQCRDVRESDSVNALMSWLLGRELEGVG